VTIIGYVRFEVYTAVTMKKAVFWDVRPCRHMPKDGIFKIHAHCNSLAIEWNIWQFALLVAFILSFCALDVLQGFRTSGK
jgi:hypothetical protein